MKPERDVIVEKTVAGMHRIAAAARAKGFTVGCIPTMGYLHDGHASLIRAAAAGHGLVVVSIFVNPTQFGPGEDFERYPRDLERDLDLVAQAGSQVVFAPTVDEMYPTGAKSTIHLTGITDILEGAHRPGHFDGVATVVSRLFEAMRPDEAYFGQKDLQQTLVIRRMVAMSTIEEVRRVIITVLPTQREPGGLARSSRNVYLSDQDRADARVIFRALSAAAALIRSGERERGAIERNLLATLSAVQRLAVDYVVAVEAATLRPEDVFERGEDVALLIAARIGKTRLIDNEIVCVP